MSSRSLMPWLAIARPACVNKTKITYITMLETSKDLLFVVLSFCILWLTVFLCWVIYYVAMLLKQAYTVTKSVQQKLDAFEALMNTIKERVEKSSSHLALVADGISQVV